MNDDDFDSLARQALSAPTIAPKPKSEPDYDDLASQVIGRSNSAAQAVVMSNLNSNPQAAGRAAQVGKQIGLPQAAVETDLPAYEAQAQAQKNSAIVAGNQTLADWTANHPDHARIAGDDYHNLDSVASVLQPKPTLPSMLTGIGHSFALNAYLQYQGFLLRQADINHDEKLQGEIKRNIQIAQQVEKQDTPQFDSKLGQWTYGGVSGLAGAVPGLLATGINPLLGAAIFGGQALTQAYGKYSARGATVGEALGGATAEGIINVAASFLPLKFINEQIGKIGIGKFIGGLIVRDIPAAQAQTIATSIVDTAIANPDKSWSDFVDELPEHMGEAAVSALVFSGAMGAAHKGAQKLAGDNRRAAAAEADAQTMQGAVDAANASTLRERAPEAFKEFTEAANKSGIDEVYIDANALTEALAQSKIPAEWAAKIPEIAEQMPEAMALGGDIKLPLSALVTHLPGSGLEAAIIPHLRTSQGAMSALEAAAHTEAMPKRMTELAAQEEANYQQEQPLREIYNDVYGQLLAAGKDPATADSEARLWRERLTSRAERLGVDPWQLYQENPLLIRREIPPILAEKKTVDLSLDPLLNELRSGKAATQKELFGDSLIDFLREKGGVKESGGELGARDVEAWDKSARKPGQRKLVNAEGVDLDQAALLAHEHGYIQTDDVNTFMAALDREIAGEPVFKMGAENSELAERKKQLDDLHAYLKSIRADPSKMNNAEIRRAIADDMKSRKDEGGLEQKKQQNTNINIAGNTLGGLADAIRKRFGATKLSEGLKNTEGGRSRYYSLPDGRELRVSDHEFPRRHGAGVAHVDIVYNKNDQSIVVIHNNVKAGIAKEISSVALDLDGNNVGQLKAFGGDKDAFNAAVTEAITNAIGNRGSFDPNNPNILYQDEKPRGLFIPSKNLIVLLKDANFSTFLHESGHSWLEDMRTDAQRENAPQQMKDDWAIIKQWAGIGEDNVIAKNSHEQFARGMEAYMREGKAPSKALEGVFARFKDWLVRIYKNINDLNVELTPEVRGVMDRLLATDEAIKEARESQGYETPLLDKAGMTEAEYTAYANQYKAAQEEANTEVRNKLMAELDRENRAWWKEERQKMRAAVEKEVNALPAYRALHWLQKGVFPDGSALEDMPPVKLSKDALVRSYGEGILKSLPRPYVYQAEGGVHPDLIAERLGFDTGADLVKALAESKARVKLIEAETDQRMHEKYGDMLNDGALPDQAMMAVHNDRQAEVFQIEQRILRRRGAQGEVTSIDTMKAIARHSIANKTVGELDPQYYARAERKAGREAEQALLGKDTGKGGVERNLDKAYDAKQRQILNHYLFREAQAQKDAVQAGVDYQKKFDKKRVRDGLPGEFVEQIDGLRQQFDFGGAAARIERKKQALITWAASQRKFGYEPAVSDWLYQFETPMHYKDLKASQFNEVIAALKSIEHIARDEKLVDKEGKRVSLDSAVEELLVPMRERGDKFSKADLLEPPQEGVDPPAAVALHKTWTWFSLSQTDLKPQDYKHNKFDFQRLFGPFGNYIFERLHAGAYRKNRQLKAISDESIVTAKQLGREWQKSLYDLVPNRLLLDPDLSEPGKPVFMKITRKRLGGIIRHIGNESNFQKLARGMQWDPADIWKFVHDNATEKDFLAAKYEGAIYEKYWPEIEALAKRMGGAPPEKIIPRPFMTKFGEMPGWYAPIDYHPLRSKLGAKFAEMPFDPNEDITDSTIYNATTTFNGSMVNRIEGYTDSIDLDSYSTGKRIRDTIHDLAYRETLIDINKILNHPEFKDQFMRTFGRQEYAGMQKLLLSIKGFQRGEDNIHGFERFLQYTRMGMLLVAIPWRVSTVLVHGGSAGLKTFGYFAGGMKYLAARFLRMTTGNARADIAAASEKFPEIRNRKMQMDRDYRQGLISMYEPESWGAKNDRFGHSFVAWSDLLTAVPTAWAAYDRAITDGVPVEHGGTGKPMTEEQAVRYANKIVREAHGTALETNRSLFMQSRGIKGLFGTIYGFMNNTYGQMADMWDKSFSGGHYQDRPAMAARALATVIIPGLWVHYIRHGGPSDDEEWYEWAAMGIGGEIAASFPFMRDAWSMIEYPHARGIGQVAPTRVMFDTVKMAKDILGEFEGEDTKLVQDTANALGALLHIGGAGQAGKTLQYLLDVQRGEETPEDPLQALHDATLGNKEKHH